jgi:hypothetical protein
VLSLPALTARDAAADPMLSCFKFGAQASAGQLPETVKGMSPAALHAVDWVSALDTMNDRDSE